MYLPRLSVGCHLRVRAAVVANVPVKNARNILLMLSEESIRSSKARANPDKVKLRFTERMWNWITQDQASDGPSMLNELGSPDGIGVYSCCSTEGQSLYVRQAHRPQSGFEWSVEKLVWHPTSQVIGNDVVLCEEHQILVRHLEAERLLLTGSATSSSTVASTITHPPELELPHSLKHPEIIKGEVSVPEEFRCPLGSAVMSQPVVTPAGLSFDRGNIEQWIARFGTDPATRAPLTYQQLYPNLALRDLIQGFVVQHRDKLDPELLRRVSKECVGGPVPCVSQRSDPGALPLLAHAAEQRSINGMPPASFMIGRTSSNVGDNQSLALEELSSPTVEALDCDPVNRDDIAAVRQATSSGGV